MDLCPVFMIQLHLKKKEVFIFFNDYLQIAFALPRKRAALIVM